MPQLNIDLDYFNHPKVMLLAEELGDSASILPIRLWIFTAKFHAQTGEIVGHSAKLIERHLAWTGEKGQGIDALVRYGFLEPIDGGYRVHDFLEYQGHLAAFKARGRAAAESRWGNKNKMNNATSIPQAMLEHGTSNAKGMSQAMLDDGASNAPTNVTNGRINGANKPNSLTDGEPREVFNPGMHHDVKNRASRLVDLYLSETKTTHLNTKSAAIRDLAQFMLDCPKTNDSEIEHGIQLYAKQLDKNQTPFNRRQGPLRFVQDRAWESYAGMTESRAMSESELLEAVRRERERNERLAT